MVQGVNFTPEAARRITDAVKKIEGLPTPTNTQRHRAGGLGRMTLWEVTAVQTTPKTVTIKRVENQDGDLVDPSERTEILYDPDNEPSVGDQGLLIRLGEGSLFFFSREGLGPIIDFDILSYIDNLFPDSKSSDFASYPIQARTSQSDGPFDPLTINRGLIKFERKILAGPGKALITLNFSPLTVSVSSDSPKKNSITGALNIWPITNDYDAPNVTWNNVGTTVTLGPQIGIRAWPLQSFANIDGTVRFGNTPNSAWLEVDRFTAFGLFLSWTFGNFSGDSYGLIGNPTGPNGGHIVEFKE